MGHRKKKKEEAAQKIWRKERSMGNAARRGGIKEAQVDYSSINAEKMDV